MIGCTLLEFVYVHGLEDQTYFRLQVFQLQEEKKIKKKLPQIIQFEYVRLTKSANTKIPKYHQTKH